MREPIVVTFVPRRELAAQDNVDAFVRLCRERLTAFGRDLDFDSPQWDTTSITRRRASSARDRIYFTRNGRGRRLSQIPLAEPFGSFARAFIRYQQGLRPTLGIGGRLVALRALEHALCLHGRSPEVHRTTSDTMNAAVLYLRSRLGPTAAYQAAANLERIGHFLDEHCLVAVPLQWRNPLKRPQLEPRLGPEFEARRRKVLPSRRSLEALAAAFNEATHPADVLIASIAALQFCAIPRICETLTIPADSETLKLKADGAEGFAMRWWPAKGNKPTIKWLTPGMEATARRALRRLKDITAPARAIARWYEKNPQRIFLPHELEHLREREFITLEEADQILGGTRGHFALRGRPCRYVDGRKLYRFRDLERYVLSLLPNDFPVYDRHVGTSFGEALLVVQRGFLGHPGVEPMRCMIQRVSSQHVRAGLGCRTLGTASVFLHLGLTEEDGTAIRLNPHSLRHYLTDLALRNGVSEVDAAAWAGRHPRQNIHYNSMSDAEQLDRIRAVLSGGDAHARSSALAKHAPVARSDIALSTAPAVHTTELGFCLHVHAMLPCQLHRDCLFCTEHACIKGDARRKRVAKRWLRENRALLDRARTALGDREFGADRWVEHCQKAVDRLSELVSLLEDPTIRDGTVIQLARGPVPSRIREAFEARELRSRVEREALRQPGED